MSFPAPSRTPASLARAAPPPRPPARHGDHPAAEVHRVAGRCSYDVRGDRWSCSPEMVALHGMAADTREFATEHLLQTLHPEDRRSARAAVTAACTEGRPFSLRVRIARADGAVRSAVLVGEPEAGDDGEVTALHGTSIDLTGCPPTWDDEDRAGALELEVAQMRAAMASRATIEQAKGILMLLTSCSDPAAFELLAHISSHTHRKVRQVAESITESAAGQARLPDDVGAIVRDACPPAAPRG